MISKLPYIKLQNFYILIDTGSSQNFINKDHVYKNLSKFRIFKENFVVNTMNGESKGEEYTFIKYKDKSLKCYLYNFHSSFHILLGFNGLKILNAQINLPQGTVTMLSKFKHKFEYFDQNSKHTVFNSEILKELNIPTENLHDEEEKALSKLLYEFQDLIPTENEKLTFTSKIKHKIRTTNEIPVYSRNYRCPEIYKEEIDRQVSDLLQNEIIRKSYSPWSSPIWMVPKKLDASGKQKFRMVIDYRRLNEHTIDDKFPIPDIPEILDKLGKSNYFSTIDLKSGFHQIEMDPKDIEKTAFSTGNGHYEFTRMPFGLKNAPSTFQRLMNYVLHEYINKICFVYLDDVIILGSSLQEHTENISKVFKKFREANLKIQTDKSNFFRKEVAYLGHIITTNGIKPNPDKIKTIKNFPIPKTVKEIKSFLGLLGYYRRFIDNYAKVTKPLTQCLRKGSKIDINDKNYIECFKTCKELLSNSPILQYPDFDKEFILTTDASNYALGAVLSQRTNNKDLPIAFASRTLNKHEENYSTIEKELLAIVWATKQFRPYLLGRNFKIVTDHRPLVWLNSLKEPNQKLIRWKLKLGEYNYKIEYKKGNQNHVADCLSRIKPSFKIEYKNGDIFQSKNTLIHAISKDFKMGKGFAEQVNRRYQTKNKMNKVKIISNTIAIQTEKERTIIHLLTKDVFDGKPNIPSIKKCLNKLMEYLIANDIYEIDLPKICSGLDRQNWTNIENLIKETFQNSSIIFNIYEKPGNNKILNYTSSVIVELDKSSSSTLTAHSDDEQPINGLTYIESPVNVGKNQIIVKEINGKNQVKIEKLFDNKVQRIYLYLNKINCNKTILEFIRQYLQPGINYYCLIQEKFIKPINTVIQTMFRCNSYKLISCKSYSTTSRKKTNKYHKCLITTKVKQITEVSQKLNQI